MKIFKYLLLVPAILLSVALPDSARGATLVVTSGADSGPGSLRATVTGSSPGDIIKFADSISGQTIVLIGGQITLSHDINIDGSSLASRVRLDGNGASRILFITNGANVHLAALGIAHGFDNSPFAGGGIYNGSNCLLNVSNCLFASNQVSGTSAGGGALHNDGLMNVICSTFVGNSAFNGAALGNRTGTVAVFNSTFTANSATNLGGAIANSGTLLLYNATIVSNSAGAGGGGIDNLSTACMTNCIVSGNGANGDVAGALAGAANNLVGVSGLNLAPLGFYGGPTPTMPPLAGSPAIDAGLDSVTNLYILDQRGFARLTGAHIDVGAVEEQSPLVSIASPTNGAALTNLNIIATGTASCSDGVAGVFLTYDGSALFLADTSDNWAHWSAPLTLSPGLNTLSAYTLGSNGLFSLTNNVDFDFALTNFVTVTKRGQQQGILTIVINELGGGKPQNRVAGHKSGDQITLGHAVTLTANPGLNQVFSNWVFGNGQPYHVTNTPVLKFSMESNFIAEANFATNMFSGAAGTYFGLFGPLDGAPRQQSDSGAIKLTVAAKRAFSGKLRMGTASASFTGKFDASGQATISTKLNSVPTAITLQLNFSNDLALGTVSNADFVSPAVAYLNPFSAKNKAANFAGSYTMIMPGATNPAVAPLGTSFGTVKISRAGLVSFSGSLADGTAVSASSAIQGQGIWPLYIPLYQGEGSFWSWNLFGTNPYASARDFPISGAAPSWINLTNSARDAIYRAGFTNTNAVIYGSPYSSATPPSLANLTGDSVLLQGGDLPGELTNTLAIGGNPDATNVVLTFNKNTGAFTGTFLNGEKKVKLKGVFLQSFTNIGAYFLGANRGGLMILEQ